MKAAHLTIFAMLGYSYTMSASGRFIGWDVLGHFVASNMPNNRKQTLKNAAAHFAEFKNLVRPMLAWPEYTTGTISDSELFLCTGTPKHWAFMVLVRAGKDMHAVLIPTMEDAESAARFIRFLKDAPPRIEIRRARFEGDHWDVAKDTRYVEWPPVDLDAAV